MTTTVSESTRDFVLTNSVEAITTSVGLVAIILLLVLLAQQEVVRALAGPRMRGQVRALSIAIVPLAGVFALTVVLRAIDILD